MKSSDLDTRQKLIQVARKLFARHNYESVSVRMICDEAGTNVSSISYHFGGKEELYRTCLLEHGKGIQVTAARILQKADTQEEVKFRIKMFIAEMYETAVQDADVLKMILKEMDNNLRIAEDIFSDVYMKLGENFQNFIIDAQQKGFIRPEIDPLFLDRLIHSQLITNINFHEMSCRYNKGDIMDPACRDKTVDQFMKLFTGGILA